MSLPMIVGMVIAVIVRMAVLVDVHRPIVRGWAAECSLRCTRYWEI